MKKKIFILILLMLFTVGCQDLSYTNKDDSEGQNELETQEERIEDNTTDILDKYGNVIKPIDDLTEEFPYEYRAYFGVYEGYSVFLKYSPLSWADIDCFAFNEMIFCIHDNYAISLYNEEGTISLKEAIEADLLKEESIRNIHYYYNKYIVEESNEGYASTFLEQINLLEMVNTYYFLENGKVSKYQTFTKLMHISLEMLKLGQIDKDLCSKLGVEFEYGKYLGLYDYKYHLYLLEDESGLESFELCGYTFKNDSKFRLVAVYNDEVIEVSKLIEDGKMSEKDIMKLAFNFKIIQREYTYEKLNDKEFDIIYK